MKITLDIPDSTKCVSVSIVFDGPEYPSMSMAARMMGTMELEDGGEYQIPKGRGEEK